MRLSKTFSMAVDKVGHAFKKAYQVIRPRTTGIILDIAIYCLPVYALTWYFDLLEGLSLRIFMSLLVAMAPASELLSDPRPLKSRGDLLVFALFIVPAFLLVTSQKFDWHILGLNAALGLAVFPWILLVWWLLGRNWLDTCVSGDDDLLGRRVDKDRRVVGPSAVAGADGHVGWSLLGAPGSVDSTTGPTLERSQDARAVNPGTGHGHDVFPGDVGSGGRSRNAGTEPGLVGGLSNHRGSPIERGNRAAVERLPAGMGKPVAEPMQRL